MKIKFKNKISFNFIILSLLVEIIEKKMKFNLFFEIVKLLKVKFFDKSYYFNFFLLVAIKTKNKII